MRLSGRETQLRWMFLIGGWFLFVCHSLVLHNLLYTDALADSLFPDNPEFLINLATLWLALVMVLCFITAWGIKRQRPWSRRTGIVTSVLLLPGAPWLTIAGVVGLCLIQRGPVPQTPPPMEEDYWQPGRQSLFGAIIQIAGFLAAMQCLSIFERYATQMGMRDPDISQSSLNTAMIGFGLLLFVLLCLHSAIHESGHLTAAWLAGYRVKVISAGPVTWRRDALTYRFRVEWKRLLLGGGYVGAVPSSENGVWPKEIFVVAAGPLTSLGAGVLLTLAFFRLPGTPLAPYWLIFAVAALQGYYGAVVNLIPAGYTDGTMLFHLILRTARGKQLIARILSGQAHQDAVERRRAGDHESNLALQRAALERLIAGGGHAPLQLALAHSQLGLAELAAGSAAEAEKNFRASLDVVARIGGNPAIEADCWTGLHRVFFTQQRPEDAGQAYRNAWGALIALGKNPPAGIDRLAIQAGLAELHCAGGAFEPALAVITDLLANLNRSAQQRRLRGLLLRFRARCELQLGHPGLGRAIVAQAASFWRNAGSKAADGPQEIGLLGLEFSLGGQAEAAVPLLRESIELFEKRGEPNPAARFRLLLAEVLRKAGRIDEARQVLPLSEQLPGELHRQFLEERAAVDHKAGRLGEAMSGYREALRLIEGDPRSNAGAVNTVKSSLAGVCLEAGQVEEAESLAQEAWNELSAAGDPEAATACITLGLISWHHSRTPAAWFDEGLRRVEDAPLLLHANKARFFEATAARLEKTGLDGEASRFRLAAERHWAALGVGSSVGSCALVASQADPRGILVTLD
ncbi:MAG TPA: site-2 protease family protein [Bryobacteraceae bacterium]|nr:site-2 protease family protein [Bryobacteraceae bacterium]